MIVWRICAERYAAETLTGRGGLRTSGRWHTAGHAVVYTSGSLALAALETLAHVDKDLMPPSMVQVEIDVPDDLVLTPVETDSLPRDWRLHPAPPRLQRIGDRWLAGNVTPVLRVPSAVIPVEPNYLLNPRHPDLTRVVVASVAPFALDLRLLS